MADLSQAALAASSASLPRPKYRIRFRKAGDLRLVSHHDLMKCFERMLRRAEVPLAVSQGFHPKPKMVFALSLGLGIIGSNEVLELELSKDWPEEELHRRLRDHAPPGIVFHSVSRLAGKSSAQPRRAFYRLPLAGSWEALGQRHSELATRCRELMAQEHVCVERERPRPRRIDVRPFLSELRLRDDHLEMALWVTPHGTARADELARLLGLGDLLDSGVCFDRTNLEMLDEVPDGALPAMDPSVSSPTLEREKVPVRREERAAAPTPLMSGPLSFDS